jgi:multiple sugar transport system substrate-binding protein
MNSRPSGHSPRTPLFRVTPRNARRAHRSWLMLFAMLPLLFVAACGGGGGGGKTLRVLIPVNANYGPQQQQWMQQVNADFKKKTGATISWDTFNGTSEEETKLQTAITSGSGPDVFQIGTTFVPTAQSTGGFNVLSSDDWQKAGGKDRFFQQQLTMSGISPDKQIAVPFVMRPFVMVYNKALFQKAGISAPPKTWTEFVNDAQKMTNASAGVYGAEMDPSDSFDPWKIWWTFALQDGGRFLSKDLKQAHLDSAESVSAVQFWFDWATKYKIVDPSSMSWKAPDALRAFANGKAAMLIMVTPTIRPTLDKSTVKGQYAFAPMPTVPYGMQQPPSNAIPVETIVSGDDLAVANYSQNQDLAYQFINLVTDKAHQLQFTKDFGDLPTNVDAAQQLASQDPQTAAFVEAEKGATPTPMTGEWGSLEVTLAGVSSKLANAVATHNYSPSQAQTLMSQANQQVQGQLHEGTRWDGNRRPPSPGARLPWESQPWQPKASVTLGRRSARKRCQRLERSALRPSRPTAGVRALVLRAGGRSGSCGRASCC